jgi:hypothetical protein
VITGAHVLVYSADAAADRRFLAETFGFPALDAGEGWLIFALPPAELAVHPAGMDFVQRSAEEDLIGCVLYLMCDDVAAERARLAALGAQCSRPVQAGWGVATTIRLPSGGRIGLYEPRHPSPSAEAADGRSPRAPPGPARVRPSV